MGRIEDMKTYKAIARALRPDPRVAAMHGMIRKAAAMFALRVTGERGPYVPQPGEGHRRAQARLARQREIWADTPAPTGMSRQVRRRLAGFRQRVI